MSQSSIQPQHFCPWIPFLILLFNTGCLSERPTPGTDHERLVVSVDKAIHTIDPRFTYDTTSMKISQMVFSALTTVDNGSLEPTLELASEIRLDPDNPRLWHVHLRKDISFHDGRPHTGKDVAYTYRSVLDPSFASPFYGDFSAKLKSIHVDPADPHHVLFTVHKPYATFLTDLVLGIVPAWLEHQPKGLFPAQKYIGTGAFRFVEQSHNRRMILERNDQWHHPPSSYRWLVFKTIPDESTRLLSLLGGSTDLLLNGISPILLDVLDGHDGIRVESAPSIVFTYMGFNLRQPELADPRVRRAIAMAIDRDKIIQRRFMGKAAPATSMLPTLHWAHNPDIPLLKTDLEKAKKLLDEAGFTPDPETGIR